MEAFAALLNEFCYKAPLRTYIWCTKKLDLPCEPVKQKSKKRGPPTDIGQFWLAVYQFWAKLFVSCWMLWKLKQPLWSWLNSPSTDVICDGFREKLTDSFLVAKRVNKREPPSTFVAKRRWRLYEGNLVHLKRIQRLRTVLHEPCHPN